jgi:hypothetical protein
MDEMKIIKTKREGMMKERESNMVAPLSIDIVIYLIS